MNSLVSFTPLMRQSVGFDRFNDLFETLLNETEDRFDSYPPYNIEKHGDDQYRIVLAVAGFSEDEITITAKEDRLIVSAQNMDKADTEEDVRILHRGIASRAFERTFRLADYIKVTDASLKDGLLTISLEREIPEEKKPRMIPIKSGAGKKLLGKGKTN